MTTPTLPVFLMDYVYDVVQEACLRNILHPLNGEIIPEVLEFVIASARVNRYELVRTPEQLHRLWDDIRAKQEVVDFILNLTIDVRLRLDSGPLPWDELVTRLLTSYTQFRGTHSGIDEVLVERLPSLVKGGVRQPASIASINDLYTDNPWFVMMVLMHHAGVARRVATQANK
jgi:hypothetical protein